MSRNDEEEFRVVKSKQLPQVCGDNSKENAALGTSKTQSIEMTSEDVWDIAKMAAKLCAAAKSNSPLETLSAWSIQTDMPMEAGALRPLKLQRLSRKQPPIKSEAAMAAAAIEASSHILLQMQSSLKSESSEPVGNAGRWTSHCLGPRSRRHPAKSGVGNMDKQNFQEASATVEDSQGRRGSRISGAKCKRKEAEAEADRYKFQCRTCGKYLLSAKKLEKHMQTKKHTQVAVKTFPGPMLETRKDMVANQSRQNITWADAARKKTMDRYGPEYVSPLRLAESPRPLADDFSDDSYGSDDRDFGVVLF